KAGKQGRVIGNAGDQEEWAKAFFDGGQPVGLFIRGGAPEKITVKGTNLGMKPAPASARDLWAHGDLKLDGAEYSVTVPAHGVVMLKIAASSGIAATGIRGSTLRAAFN